MRCSLLVGLVVAVIVALALQSPLHAAAEPESKPIAAEKKTPKSEAKAEKPKKTEPLKQAAEKEKPAPPTVPVKRETVEVKLTLDGSFQARTAVEIAVRPKQWSSLKVAEAVKHGAIVKRGDVLIRFETEALDRAIADQKAALELADLSLKQAEEELKLLEAATPMDLELAERSFRMAKEDLDRFLEIDGPMSRKSAEFSLQNAKDYLEYEKEELRQLEKMYKADELTEETEEIILKRQRDAVRRAEFNVEEAEHYYKETISVRLPRQQESLREASRRAEIAMKRAQATLPIALNRQRLELDKMKVRRQRDQKKLDELLADRQQMTVKSPVDGVVYYGRWSMGEWSGASSAAADLRPGATVSANKVVMTVVRPRPLVLRVTVPEKELHWIQPGLEARIKPTGFPDVTLSGRVDRVAPVPISSGNFEAELTVRLGNNAPPLMPGMTAKVELVPYKKVNALTVPLSALSTDQLDARRIFVQVVEDGKARKRRVQVGRRSGERVEIVSGLAEGEVVLKEYPKAED